MYARRDIVHANNMISIEMPIYIFKLEKTILALQLPLVLSILAVVLEP